MFLTFCFSSGTFAECSSEVEVQYWMRYNIFLLLDVGTFSALVELLNMEIEYVNIINILSGIKRKQHEYIFFQITSVCLRIFCYSF